MKFKEILTMIQKSAIVNPIKITNNYPIEKVSLLDTQQTNFIKNSPSSQVSQTNYNHTLYFVLEDLFNEYIELPPCCIFISDKKPSSQQLKNTSDCAQINKSAFATTFNKINDLLSTKPNIEEWSQQLLTTAHQTQNIHDVIDSASEKLGNPLILIDCHWKILAYSRNFVIKDALWQENIQQGYCDYEFIQGASQMEPIKSSPNSTDAVEMTCPASPYRKLYSKLIDGNEKVGTLLLLEQETNLNLTQFQWLPQVSQIAQRTIKTYYPQWMIKKTAYEHLLYNLLIGATLPELQSQIVSLEFPAYLQILTLNSTKKPPQLSYLVQFVEEIQRNLEYLVGKIHYITQPESIVILIGSENPANLLSSELKEQLVILAKKI